jgi:tetraacyldisaccharide 4'-kinase
MYVRFKSKKPQDFDIPIIGVGNLNVGGSGKTPFITALAQNYNNTAIILRGYGRESQGLHVVSDGNNTLVDVGISGDEAMIYAHKLPKSIVIVSEDRKKAIQKAKEMGAKVVFLDDAYSKHDIKKLDLVLHVESKNNFCLPAGAFRERLWTAKEAVVLFEGEDFKRFTQLKDAKVKMSLVTAIARPTRLDKYLPEVVSKNYFEDHHAYTKEELEEILKRDKSDSLLLTYKDYVKVESFDLPVSLLDLDVEIDKKVFSLVDEFIQVSK